MIDVELSVVAVDIGTSAVRAAAVTIEGQLLRSVRRPRSSNLGGELFDAEALWNDVQCVLLSLEAEELDGVAIVVSAHIGTVAIDESMVPVVAGGGWADHRGLGRLIAQDRDRIDLMLRSSGRPTASGGAIALALELSASGLGKGVHALLSPKDYVVAKLTGCHCTDTVNAAYSMVADIRTGDWQYDELSRLGIPASWFPAQIAPADIVSEVSTDAALACGLPKAMSVVAGGPDGSVGMGLLLGSEDEVIADVAGTTDVLGMLVDDATGQPSDAIVNPSVVAGHWTVGGSTGLTGGAVAEWRSLVGAVDEQELARIAPGSDGLRVVPGMSGERFPRWRANAKGALFGLRTDHGPAHILRGTQEAACFTVREGLDLLDPGLVCPVNIAGGTVRSRSAAQMRADVFGRQLRVASDPDITLLGSAGLALIAVGAVSDLGEARDRLRIEFSTIEPQTRRSTKYDSIFADWREAREISMAYAEDQLHRP